MHGPLNVKYSVLTLSPFTETGSAAYPVVSSCYFSGGGHAAEQ